MDKQALICVFEHEAFAEGRLSAAMEVIDAEMDVYGAPLRFHIGVQEWMAPMSALVPTARRICDAMLGAVLEHHESEGQAVSCRKGCAACCSYLVGLSTPEVFRMRAEFARMPGDDRIPILKSSLHAAREILKQKKPTSPANEGADLQQISDWYRGLNLRCPFLQGGLCSIYDQRPLACREYFVESPPDWCFTGHSHRPAPQPVQLPFSVAEVLGQAAELEGTEEEAVILPLALIGTDDIVRRSRRLWPAVEMVTRFLCALEAKAACTPAAVCATEKLMP